MNEEKYAKITKISTFHVVSTGPIYIYSWKYYAQMLIDLPFLCMFSDGAGRTGSFIAISIVMEQLKLEHSIDVFQTIKKIRTTRPEFVQNYVSFILPHCIPHCISIISKS